MESEEKTVAVDVNEAFIVKSDAGDLCRLCANTDNQLIPIFRGEGLEHNIPNKIEKHLPIIKVTEIDKLPLQICYQCASTLIAWHNLYEGCRVADKRLREILCIDDKLYQDDEPFGDYVDDYRDDYDDQSRTNYEAIPLSSTPSTSDLPANNLLKNTSTEITQLDEAKTFNETELDSTDERCAARGTRKRGPLTTKNPTDEERAKIVKSKKIRLLAQTKPRKIEKHKCTICGAAFTDANDLEWHKDTSHSAIKGSAIRKSTRIQSKKEIKRDTIHNVSTISDLNDYEIDKVTLIGNTTDKSEKSNANNETLYCHDCEYSSKRKSTLLNHIRQVHHKSGAKRSINHGVLSCAVCLRTFIHKTNLRKHMFSVHFSRSEIPGSKWRKLYCCDICGEGYPGQRDMLAHRSVEHENAEPMIWSSFTTCSSKVRYCEKCTRYYRSEKFFDAHKCQQSDNDRVEKMKRMLEAKPSYKCDLCCLCFHFKMMYRSHREVVHPEAEPINWKELAPIEIEHYCGSCSKAFPDADMLEQHASTCIANTENTSNVFRCELCSNSYSRKADYKKHIRSKHENAMESLAGDDFLCRKKSNIKCPYCDLETPTRNGILEHIKQAHNIETDTPFVCVPCNKVFKRKATMDAHNQVYHPKEENVEETNKILQEAEILLNGETAYHCNVCNRNMLNSVRFIAHYRLHYVERKFTCDLCGKQTRTQHQLNTHIKIIHLNIRNHECDICGKSFHSKQSCEEHRRIHTGERPFSCEICGKTFVAMNALFTHKKFHNDFYAHPCSMCPKKFKVRRSLINHIRTHTGERPFQCDLCPKTFNNSSRFSYHKKVTHSDNRPFTCEQCGSCFKANKFLMRHMKLHNIRTHIQYRRRNNPTYFETHGNYSSNAAQKKSKRNVDGANESKNENVTPTIFTIQRVYDDVADLQFSESNENSNVASMDENVIEETKRHFLSEAFVDNSTDMEFDTSPSTSERNGNKHIVCL